MRLPVPSDIPALATRGTLPEVEALPDSFAAQLARRRGFPVEPEAAPRARRLRSLQRLRDAVTGTPEPGAEDAS